MADQRDGTCHGADHDVGIGVLHDYPVEQSAHSKPDRTKGKRVRGDDFLSNDTRAIEILSGSPLAAPLLVVANLDVVKHAVAEDVVKRLALEDVTPALPDHHHQLRLLVELIAYTLRAYRRAAWC